MGLAHFKILIFSDFSSMGVGLKKRIVKFCHTLQVANFSMRSLCYVNITTFESSLCVVLFKTGMFQRIKN